ncbi:hypothetical protein UYSO10_0555 [Kosakonia radicincitans]|nr:hypothetical protein UYSO10_0555 [Kosakonia radicincitans]
MDFSFFTGKIIYLYLFSIAAKEIFSNDISIYISELINIIYKTKK